MITAFKVADEDSESASVEVAGAYLEYHREA
jgi:hypothetical protein